MKNIKILAEWKDNISSVNNEKVNMITFEET